MAPLLGYGSRAQAPDFSLPYTPLFERAEKTAVFKSWCIKVTATLELALESLLHSGYHAANAVGVAATTGSSAA